MFKSILFFLALSITPLTAQAGEWKSSGLIGPYANALNFSSTSGVPSRKSGFYIETKLENKINSNWRFKSELNFRNDFESKDDLERLQFLPRNFYLQKRQNSFVFRLGLQTLSIDGPDIINPSDVVHAKNWIDPTSPQTLGSAGLSISQEIKQWNWEFLYIPKQTTPILPGEHSPWLPRRNRLPIESENTEMRIPNDVKYKYTPAAEIEKALKNNLVFKIQNKSEKFESQFVFYDGLAHSPFLLIDAQATLISSSPQVLLIDSPVKLRQLYYRQQALAASFLIPMESWVIRGGGNWLKPRQNDDRLPTETRTGVLGIEKSIESRMGMMTGILQYIRQENLSQNQISFLRSIFEEALTAGLRLPYGEETTFLIGGLYDLVGNSSMYQLTASHRISDSWSAEIGGKFIEGPKDTLLGLYGRHDSYQLRTLYYW